MNIAQIDPDMAYAQRNALLKIYQNFPNYDRAGPNTVNQIKYILDGKKNAQFPNKEDLYDVAFQVSKMFIDNWFSKNFLYTFQKCSEHCIDFDLEFIKELQLEEWDNMVKIQRLIQKIFTLYAQGLIINNECFEFVFEAMNSFLETYVQQLSSEVDRFCIKSDVQEVCDTVIACNQIFLKYLFGFNYKYPVNKQNVQDIESSQEELVVFYRNFKNQSSKINSEIQRFGKTIQLQQSSSQVSKYYGLKRTMTKYQEEFSLQYFDMIDVKKQKIKKQQTVLLKRLVTDVIIKCQNFPKIKLKGLQDDIIVDHFYDLDQLLVYYDDNEVILLQIKKNTVKFDQIRFQALQSNLIDYILQSINVLELQMLLYVLVNKFISNGYTQIQIIFSLSQYFQDNFYRLNLKGIQFLQLLTVNNLPLIQITKQTKCKDFEKSQNSFNYLFKAQIQEMLINKLSNQLFSELLQAIPNLIEYLLISLSDLISIVNTLMQKILEIQITNAQLQESGQFNIYITYCIKLKEYLSPDLKEQFQFLCDDISQKYAQFEQYLQSRKSEIQ
ncbi:hypothetical protein SS50377_23267 [Spironucleus salmonicida]|uniref:Uncharacterized protein n=1 Tax=Spironucleus salmonicida TaxID=348837 RepID=V6LHL1_9EUKA|nr:hypothetical protein SS50377_23267 [Spironucleus salmonicida]|eukprot:EST44060.1 Hypothetical protein SS50377_16126 [Spironucleus salmonicida]